MATTTLDCSKITSDSKTWLKNGSKGKEVTNLQTMLRTLGYYTTSTNGSKLSIDGSFGPWTEKAVTAFQLKYGTGTNGNVGPKTCKALNDAITKAQVTKEVTGFDCSKTDLKANQVNDEDMVKLLQTHLKSLGYYTSVGGKELKIDGKYETYTEEAVKKYQRAAGGLQIDGWFGEATCKKFNKTIGATKYQAPKDNNNNNATTTTTTKKEDTVKKIDVNDYQFIPKNKFYNFTINGLRLISTDVSEGREFVDDDWQTIQLMDNRNKQYMGHWTPIEQDVECTMLWEEYDKIYPYLVETHREPCDIGGHGIKSGKYVYSVTFTHLTGHWVKLNFHLIKYYDGGRKWL